MHKKNSLKGLPSKALYAVMIFFALIFLFPLIFIIISSFKPEAIIFLDLRHLWKAFIPTTFTLENYRYVFQRIPFGRYMFNSIFITGTTVLAGLFINSMLAYSLARLYWPMKKIVIIFIIAFAIIPLETISVSMLVLVNSFPWFDGSTSWLNTYRVQIIPFISDAFSTFLFYQFFICLPESLDESAKIAGSSPFHIYLHITLPLSKPVFLTVAILNSLALWNSYLWPLIVTRSESVRPLSIGITALFVLNIQWGHILAFATLMTVPIIVLFIIFQKRFVTSIASSGIKG
ncbi:MAG: carbohydrate ABC transporter permease [Spirochaetes bacterium]|nr:MAG: carbohydrate ABC transporter permease [Spirochaetota bacterium]